MTIIKRKIVAISPSPTKVRAKQLDSVHLQKKLRADAYEAPKAECPDPGPAGFDFSEDEARRVLKSEAALEKAKALASTARDGTEDE